MKTNKKAAFEKSDSDNDEENEKENIQEQKGNDKYQEILD